MANEEINNDQEATNSAAQGALKAGIIVGLVNLAVYYIAYFIDVTLLTSAWFGFGILAVMLAIVIYLGIEFRKEIGGYMKFGVAFQFVFITFIVSGLIGMVGNVLLFHIIDPALPTVLAEAQLESTLAIMDRYGAGNALTSDQIQEMRSDLIESRTFVGMAKTFGWGLILYAIIALILGAIIKKRDKSLEY